MSLVDLPINLLQRELEYLDYDDVLNFCSTSKIFKHALCHDPLTWRTLANKLGFSNAVFGNTVAMSVEEARNQYRLLRVRFLVEKVLAQRASIVRNEIDEKLK